MTNQGRFIWPARWHDRQTADICSLVSSCISSMNATTPTPPSAAAAPTVSARSTRSNWIFPVSATPRDRSTPRLIPSTPMAIWNEVIEPRARLTASVVRSCQARCLRAALESSNASDAEKCSGAVRSASSRITSHSRVPARPASSPSSTVLPTPRKPWNTMLRDARPDEARSIRISKDSMSSSRPASAAGRSPAPGLYGFLLGST